MTFSSSSAFPFGGSVLIGRFQPFHNEHLALLRLALRSAPRALVILGSAFHAPNAKNPFTDSQRQAMILDSLEPSERERVSFHLQPDLHDDRAWAESVRSAAEAAFPHASVCLIGHEKDASSYYLRLFPDFFFEGAPASSPLSSTEVREALFSESEYPFGDSLPAGSLEILRSFRASERFPVLQREWAELKLSRPGISVAADVIALRSGRVLLIRRGGAVGHGLWALPGGFVEPEEAWMAAALRELSEETLFSISPSEAAASLRAQRVFDKPGRSLRGRVITQAFVFDLGDGPLPSVEPSDGELWAEWVLFGEVADRRELMHDDHWHILREMVPEISA